MCIFTQFFKDCDFRSSGMAKTGCKKVYIYHIFLTRYGGTKKKTFDGMVTTLKILKKLLFFVTIFRHAVTKTLFWC